MRKYILILFAASLNIYSLFAVSYQVKSKLNVLATNLNMREKPDAKAKVVSAIPYAAKVTVMEKTEEAFESEGIPGNWVKVEYGKKTGYVFDGYLSVLPAPAKECKSLQNYAESRLSKSGKGSEKVLTTLQKEAGISRVFVQQYKEAEFEQTYGYEENWDILTFKNLSMEEAFLIGRLCGGQSSETYRNEPFIKGKNSIIIQGKSPVTEELTIEKKENGAVMLKAYAGV